MKTQIQCHAQSAIASSPAKSGTIIDQRPEVLAQAKLREMADSSPGTARLKATQQLANEHNAIQRQINVHLVKDEKTKKTLWARGRAKKFLGGSPAGNYGWLGVKKYRAWYQIIQKDGTVLPAVDSRTLKNKFTNPERGHVLGQQNGGNGSDPENVFAQDGGSNNGPFKSFETLMRNALNNCDDDDTVKFRCYLAGDKITSGKVTDDAESDASDIESDSD